MNAYLPTTCTYVVLHYRTRTPYIPSHVHTKKKYSFVRLTKLAGQFYHDSPDTLVAGDT